jgi:hypothetical protein
LVDENLQTDLVQDVFAELTQLIVDKKLPDQNYNQICTRICIEHSSKYTARVSKNSHFHEDDLLTDDSNEQVMDKFFAEWILSKIELGPRHEQLFYWYLYNLSYQEIYEVLKDEYVGMPSEERARQLTYQIIKVLKYRLKNINLNTWEIPVNSSYQETKQFNKKKKNLPPKPVEDTQHNQDFDNNNQSNLNKPKPKEKGMWDISEEFVAKVTDNVINELKKLAKFFLDDNK